MDYESRRVLVDATLKKTKATFRDRIDAWLDTKRRVEEVRASLHLQPRVPSEKMVLDDAWSVSSTFSATSPSIEDIDSIDCGLALQERGFDPVVLNLADDCQAGGCVDIGSGAQEESIFRRTSLFATLSQNYYPIEDDEGIYSPDVAIMKASEAEEWRLLYDDDGSRLPPRMAFLTVPGVKYPMCVYKNAQDRCPRLKPVDEAQLRLKVRTMLQIAAKKGHDAIVLGASGCGAWKCPPHHVAEIFREVVCGPEFQGAFRAIVFAILRGADDTADSRRAVGIDDNYDVFFKYFGNRSA